MIFKFLNEEGHPVELCTKYCYEEVPLLNQDLGLLQQPIPFKKVQELHEKYFHLSMKFRTQTGLFYSQDDTFSDASAASLRLINQLKANFVIAIDPEESKRYTNTIEARPW